MRSLGLVAIGLVTTVVGTTSGCGSEPADVEQAAPPSAVSPPSPSVAAPAAQPSAPPIDVTVNWFDLDVGDCITALPAVELGDVAVPVVDCGQPHVAEVYLRAPLAVNTALTDVADGICAAGLAEYTLGAESFSMTYLIDSNQDRTSNNPLPSAVICLLQSTDGRHLVGSARQ